MPRPRNVVPSYRLHMSSGQAITTVVIDGTRQDVYLGPHGSPESLARYAEVIAQSVGRPAPPRTAAGPTVAELCRDYLRHARTYYRHPDGTQTSEVHIIEHAVCYLDKAFGYRDAAQFDSVVVKANQRQLIDAGLCRTTCNKSGVAGQARLPLGGRGKVAAGGGRFGLAVGHFVEQAVVTGIEAIAIGPQGRDEVDAADDGFVVARPMMSDQVNGLGPGLIQGGVVDDLDVRRARRELTFDEPQRLFAAAKSSGQGVPGANRQIHRNALCLVTAATGFRGSAVASLTPAHFNDFGGGVPRSNSRRWPALRCVDVR